MFNTIILIYTDTTVFPVRLMFLTLQGFLENGGLTQLFIAMQRLSDATQEARHPDFETETELLQCTA